MPPRFFHRLIKLILINRIGIDFLVYLNEVLIVAADATALVNTYHEVLQLLIRAVLK